MDYKSITKFINENQLLVPIVLVVLFVIYMSYTMSIKKETLDNTSKLTTPETTTQIPVVFNDTTTTTTPIPRPLSTDHGALANNDYSSVAFSENKEKETLKSEDLLPKYDEASDFAKENPVSNLLKEQNFLISGYHMGVNTVMQSNKIAYHDLRSAPVIPKQNLGPFLNSSYETFGGSSGRRFFELGA